VIIRLYRWKKVYCFYVCKIKPGREFQTERYLITVEESNNDTQPPPRPSFTVDDPTMRNKPKSAVCMHINFKNNFFYLLIGICTTTVST
jgi:hypothetical protein